jgi:uncharacterized protein (TIGR02246 family)
MKRLVALALGAVAVGAWAGEVTVLRPKSSIIAEEWEYYVMVGGKPVSDLRSGDRVNVPVPAGTRSLAIHCPKAMGGYEESRIDYDFDANPRAFLALSTVRDCVEIRAMDATAAASVVRNTVPRPIRRVEYDAGKVEPVGSAAVATAAPVLSGVPADAPARDQVAAATAAWVDAFNSRDAARVTALYDSDAILFDVAESKSRSGATGIADYYQANAKRTTQRAALGERTIRVFGDTAIDSGMMTFFEMRDGQATTAPARYSLTYRSRGGKWLIVDHQVAVIR